MFSGGRERATFSAGMDLFLEQDQEMSPPHLFRGRKVAVRNCRNNQHGVLRFPEGIRRNELSWISEPWPRAISGDDFLIKLRGNPACRGANETLLAPGSKVQQWEKNLLEVKGGGKQESQSETQGGLINVLEPK